LDFQIRRNMNQAGRNENQVRHNKIKGNRNKNQIHFPQKSQRFQVDRPKKRRPDGVSQASTQEFRSPFSLPFEDACTTCEFDRRQNGIWRRLLILAMMGAIF